MKTFQLCLALAPFALYLLAIGLVNLRRRPLLITGTRETAALGLALSGFVVVGPMQLFLPAAAANRFGPYIWLLLLAFYGLSLSLWLLVTGPRLVIYNCSVAELQPVLAAMLPVLDTEARWIGDSVMLPQMGVQLHLQTFPVLRNISLVPLGDVQSFSGWRRLELSLRGALRQLETPRNPAGVSMVSAGLLLISALLFKALEDPQAVAQGLFEMLQL